MRTSIVVLLCVLVAGCTSAVIPHYLPDTNPYSRRYDAGYEQTYAAVKEALDDLGWVIEQEADPLVYEQDQNQNKSQNDVLIMSNTRQTPLFVGTRYAKLNIYIHSQDDISDVELRYLTINSLPFKAVTNYSNDAAAERILDYIGEVLAETP